MTEAQRRGRRNVLPLPANDERDIGCNGAYTLPHPNCKERDMFYILAYLVIAAVVVVILAGGDTS